VEYTHMNQEKLDVFPFYYCSVADFDVDQVGSKRATRVKIVRVVNDHGIPCAVEETTRGYHVIILSTDRVFLPPFEDLPFYDHRYAEMCYGGDNQVVLRTKCKEGERSHFIKNRNYFNLHSADPRCLEEFMNYSDKITRNLALWEPPVEDILPF